MLILISLTNAEMKWHYFIPLTVLVLNIISCLARVRLFLFFYEDEEISELPKEKCRNESQASILRRLHASISSLQRTFSRPRVHRMERAQRYMSWGGCCYFTWRLPILVVDGVGGGEKKRRKGGGDTSFFMRDCH